jgi:catechol 2,3-dioxygenase-like lactoylglutathione lyase family enzyme
MIQTTGLIEVILYVRNMEMMVHFYRDVLGLKVTYPQNVSTFEKEHWVTFWTGACTLALHSGGQGRQGKDTPKIVFGVHDIEHARSYLCRREINMSEIRIPQPGIMVCDGMDPEGNPFSLEYQQMVTDVPSQHIP